MNTASFLFVLSPSTKFPCSPCDPWIKNTHEPHGAVHGFARGSHHPMVKPRAESTAVMVVKAMLMMTLHLFLES